MSKQVEEGYAELLSQGFRDVLRFSNWQLEQMDVVVARLAALEKEVKDDEQGE